MVYVQRLSKNSGMWFCCSAVRLWWRLWDQLTTILTGCRKSCLKILLNIKTVVLNGTPKSRSCQKAMGRLGRAVAWPVLLSQGKTVMFNNPPKSRSRRKAMGRLGGLGGLVVSPENLMRLLLKSYPKARSRADARPLHPGFVVLTQGKTVMLNDSLISRK